MSKYFNETYAPTMAPTYQPTINSLNPSVSLMNEPSQHPSLGTNPTIESKQNATNSNLMGFNTFYLIIGAISLAVIIICCFSIKFLKKSRKCRHTQVKRLKDVPSCSIVSKKRNSYRHSQVTNQQNENHIFINDSVTPGVGEQKKPSNCSPLITDS